MQPPSEPLVVTAPWILPVAFPPLRDGAVVLRGHRVIGIGPRRQVLPAHAGSGVLSLDDHILLPGLANAHTHLSLTGLSGRLPTGDFYAWLAAAAREAAALAPEAVREATERGLRESWDRGTSVLGEITSRREGMDRPLAGDGPRVRVYAEFLGVTETRARERFTDALAFARSLPGSDRRAPGLSPHAPYSVWPALWAETARAVHDHDLLWSTHLAEVADEERFLLRGDGPMFDYLEAQGFHDGTFPVPGRSAGSLLEEAGLLGPRALLVHGVHLDADDRERLARSGAWLALCPRSNAALGQPPPPVRDLRRAGIRLCLGTDSRASTPDLGIWGEMRTLAALDPELPPRQLLEMATRNGALALGFPDHGWIGPGARGPLLAVPIPAGVSDPERYLVEAPGDPRIRWVGGDW